MNNIIDIGISKLNISGIGLSSLSISSVGFSSSKESTHLVYFKLDDSTLNGSNVLF